MLDATFFQRKDVFPSIAKIEILKISSLHLISQT